MADDVEAYNYIKVSYTITEIDLLPPPFETACRTYAEFDSLRSLCLDNCIVNLTMAQWRKVPFTSLEQKPIPVKHVNNIDILNTASSKLLDQIEHLCNKKCAQPACETEHYTTDLQKEERSEFDFFTILIQAPTLPTLNVTSGQKVQMSDFLIYVTSCVGTWFGASALTFSPLALRQLLSQRRQTCDCKFCTKRGQKLWHKIVSMRNFVATFQTSR